MRRLMDNSSSEDEIDESASQSLSTEDIEYHNASSKTKRNESKCCSYCKKRCRIFIYKTLSKRL